MPTSRHQLQVLLEGYGGAGSGDHLVTLEGCLTEKVDAFLVVGFGPSRIGGNAFIESVDGLIGLAGVGKDCSHVGIVLCRLGGVGRDGLLVGLYGVIHFASPAVGLGEIVVVSCQGFGGVGIFIIGDGLLELQGLLVGIDGRVETLLFFRGIGLLGSRHAIGVTERGPDEIARRIDLVGRSKIGDSGIEVSGIRGDFCRRQLFVQLSYRVVFLLGFLSGFLLSLELFRSYTLTLGSALGLLFHVEIKRVFVAGHLYFRSEERRICIRFGVVGLLVESDGITAGSDAQREILALLVGLECIFLTIILVRPNQ